MSDCAEIVLICGTDIVGPASDRNAVIVVIRVGPAKQDGRTGA